MNETKAREILKNAIQSDGSLFDLGHYIHWEKDSSEITLDDTFTIEELEAIVWWVRNQQEAV